MSATSGIRVGWLAVVAVWLGARIVYWNGFYTEDSPGYVTDAIWVVLGNYHARDHVNGLNVGTYLPVAVPLWLLGKSEAALGLWPLVCSMLGLVSLAGLSQLLLGRPFGLLAAFLYASYPGDVFFSTVVMPDALQAGWLSAAILLVVSAHATPGPRYRWTLFAGGLALGMCHLIRASDVLLVPVGLCAVASCATIWRERRPSEAVADCGAFIAGWVAVLVAEGSVYAWTSRDFLHRFHVVAAHYGTPDSIARSGLNTSAETIPFSLFAPVLWWRDGRWGQFSPDQAYHGLLFCWAVIAIAASAFLLAAAKRRENRRLVAAFVVAVIWVSWPPLYHQFGSQSVTDFVPMHRLSRHLVVYGPGAMFAIVTGCAVVAEALRGPAATWARGPVVAFGVTLLLVHSYFNVRAERVAYDTFHVIKDTYIRIREHLPDDTRTIVGDPGDLCFLDFWMNPLGSERVRVVPYSNYPSCDRIREGVVLTESNPGWQGNAQVIVDTVARLPCLINPPATWRQIYQGFPEKVYLVGQKERDARQ